MQSTKFGAQKKKKFRFDFNIILIFTGSLLFQTVQIGAYPILISQILTNKSVDSAIIGIFVAMSWVPVLLVGPLVPRFIRIFHEQEGPRTVGVLHHPRLETDLAEQRGVLIPAQTSYGDSRAK